MRGHADAETLAAFREELLSRRKAGQVSAHLAGCPRCAALDAQLAEVTAMLTRSTAPPMPDALTARIEAALAAEAAARSGTAPGLAGAFPAGPVPAGSVPAGSVSARHGTAAPGGGGRNGARGPAGGRGRPGSRPSRSWLALRVAAVTAAVAVVAGGGYGVAQLLSAPGPAATGASAGPTGVPEPQPGSTGSRVSEGGLRSGAASGNPAPGTGSISSGTSYQRGRLGAQASAVLAARGPNARPAATPGASKAPSLPARFPGLQYCLAHVARGLRPLLVDVASYQGHPAVIIVLPATPGSRPRVLAVAPGCTASSAHILATATLPASG